MPSLGPKSPLPLRYIAICVVYVLALATSCASLVYSLAGASPVWGIAGYVLAIATVSVVSLSRYAADVSTDY